LVSLDTLQIKYASKPRLLLQDILKLELMLPALLPHHLPHNTDVAGLLRQLIVGIDFVSSSGVKMSNVGFTNLVKQGTTFSGVAFAFASNNKAKEDIIIEWLGAVNQTKQKVRHSRDSGYLKV
jgi:hypothetical protein